MRQQTTPDTLMVWTLTDRVLEHPDVLAQQFEEIRAKGFGGVATYVRCSRYTWNDPCAQSALRTIGRLCRRARMAHWTGPDPRFVSRTLIAHGEGLTVLLFGDRSRADVVPHIVPATGGEFSVRCYLSPRHVHTLNEVAIEYEPLGIVRVFAFPSLQGAADKVLDVTRHAHFFYNARDRYVEAFGKLPKRCTGAWSVLAFFAARTNHADYSNPEQMRHYLTLLRNLKRAGCAADGIMWDEPGFTCTYGTLPYSPAMRKTYERQHSAPLERELWKLALDAADDSHVPVRTTYYRAVQESLNRANRITTNSLKRIWGTTTASGIHDTWHFESADMCDMNHGSLDLWAAAKTKTGGFVDLGGVDKLRDPRSPWYAHLAAMNVIAASLGKISAGGYAYNNLWTVGDDDGEGWQTAVLAHCADAMALFGLRWMAHAYGPVGTIGEERTFLGSPFLPGYPDHSTWPAFPVWNRKLSAHLTAVDHRLPAANVLVLFPVETYYALAGPRADAASAELFRLILDLLDAHYQVDVLSPSACRRARWSGRQLALGTLRYDAVLFPSASVIPPSLAGLLNSNKAILFIGSRPERRTDGRRCTFPSPPLAKTFQEVAQWLAEIPGTHDLEAPEGSWATVTNLPSGTVISLMPARLEMRFRGPVRLGGRTAELPEQSALVRVLFPADGSAPLPLPDTTAE
jgi:hypothetical protein